MIQLSAPSATCIAWSLFRVVIVRRESRILSQSKFVEMIPVIATIIMAVISATPLLFDL
jgi:hypothetical protein